MKKKRQAAKPLFYRIHSKIVQKRNKLMIGDCGAVQCCFSSHASQTDGLSVIELI